jgi:hypothetical protein
MSRYTHGPLTPRPFERLRDIRLRLRRRVWVGVGFIAAALLVVLVTSPLVGFITENEWYNALGIGSVYRTRIAYEAWLFFLTFAISFGFAVVNVWTALRLRAGTALLEVGIRRRVLRTPLGAAGAVIALVVAAGTRTSWTLLPAQSEHQTHGRGGDQNIGHQAEDGVGDHGGHRGRDSLDAIRDTLFDSGRPPR